MPPQQADRLLDFLDGFRDFSAHLGAQPLRFGLTLRWWSFVAEV
jgi:hypothetical protein